MHYILIRFLLLSLLFGIVPATGVLAMPDPLQQVQTTVDAVLTLLGDKQMDQELRRQKIRDLVQGRFAFDSMAQRTLGTNWKTASDQEKDRFVALFSDLLEATYLHRIEAYTNEKVSYGNVRLKSDKAMVETEIVTSSVAIPIHYKLLQEGNEWMVYDVVIEGVSLIRNFRNSYDDILNREGFPGLFSRMEQKIAELKQ